MRKVVAAEFVSLDGVMEDPSLTFQFTAKAPSLEEPRMEQLDPEQGGRRGGCVLVEATARQGHLDLRQR
jgi:hypothetical protein